MPPVLRKNMRQAIGRMFLQNYRNRTDIMAEAAVISISKRPKYMMVTKSKADTPQAVKRDLLVYRRI